MPKYLLAEIHAAMGPFTVLDKYAEMRAAKEYIVRSIYFDTLGLDYYHEKIEGLKIRKKIRIRGYNEQSDKSPVFLEIKRKYENRVHKNRSSVYFTDLNSVFENGNLEDYLLQTGMTRRLGDAKRFFYNIIKNSLRPTFLVVYEREAYFSKFDPSLRITIDKNLRYSDFPSIKDLFNDYDLMPAMISNNILEIKFNRSYPQWLMTIVKRFRLNRFALSKYTISLDACKSRYPLKKVSVLGRSSPFLFNN